jgi:site-specific DNA-methyltransferase (adenine-specific)
MGESEMSRGTEPDDFASLPQSDNFPGGPAALLQANARYRLREWPQPFDKTHHRLVLGDARHLNWINDDSVHLVVTSPPYWVLKNYPKVQNQLGAIEDYETFLLALDKAWLECARVLIPGGRICCVVGDVCIPRKRTGRHYIVPLHADIQVRARKTGLDCLTPIIWHKIANGATEVQGTGGGFYGKPYQPGAVVKNDIEYILFLRKPGAYRSASPLQKALSMLSKDEMQAWFRSFWTDIRGSSTRDGHPAPFPVELATRLIRMFSFAGDTVLDPFMGIGSTCLAAIDSGRNSIGVDIDPGFVRMAYSRAIVAARRPRTTGAISATVEMSGLPREGG